MALAILLDTLETTFTDLVGSATEGKIISPPAEGYVVGILCTFATASHADPRTLHLNDLLRKGLDAEGSVRREYLQITGDLALFLSGIFPDRFETRKTAYDLGYVIDIGRTAYDNIHLELFEELSTNFPQIVEALNDVSICIKLAEQDMIRYLNRRKQIDARTTNR